MIHPWRSAPLALAIALFAGCNTSPPGGGLTNGEPLILGGSEKSAERTDMGTPKLTGDESAGDATNVQIHDSADGSPGSAKKSVKPAQTDPSSK